jgi:hypothetical protein
MSAPASRLTVEDVAIAALVVMPFTLAAVILLSWMLPLPNLVLQVTWGFLTAVGTAWIAGLRARTSA